MPVFEGRFRVAEDITIAPEAQVKPPLSPAGDLVVEGTLRYQACDAKVCYPPQNVPLRGPCTTKRWTASALRRKCSGRRRRARGNAAGLQRAR